MCEVFTTRTSIAFSVYRKSLLALTQTPVVPVAYGRKQRMYAIFCFQPVSSWGEGSTQHHSPPPPPTTTFTLAPEPLSSPALFRSAPLVCCPSSIALCSSRLLLCPSATPLVCCSARLLLCSSTPLFYSFAPLSSFPWRTLLPVSGFFVSFSRSRPKTALPPTN